MKRLIFSLLLLTALVGHAANEDIIVDGVVYTWSSSDIAYVVAGLDDSNDSPKNHIHLHGIIYNENGDDFDVVGIKAEAFMDNDVIEFVEMDDGFLYIGAGAFSGCSSVQRIKTPPTLVEIKNDAFYSCSALQYAVLNEGLVTIGERAFAYCSALEEFVIPSTIRDIKAQAFLGCKNVTDVYFMITDRDALMAPAETSGAFVWWDGWYQNIFTDYESPDLHGGIEFNGSLLPDEVIENPGHPGEYVTIEHNPLSGTRIHVPRNMYSTYVESNKLEAWLFQEDDQCHPLWWIVNYGVEGETYTVCDPLTAVYVDKHGDLYAKDDNHWLLPDKVYTGEVDYMGGSGFASAAQYDQSNWVILHKENDLEPGWPISGTIAGNTITGVLVDKRNPVIEVTSSLHIDPKASRYVSNVYIPASVMGRSQLGVNGKTYAFVRPKPQEYAEYDWTIYHERDEFYLPSPEQDNGAEGINKYCLKGGFTVNYELYENPPVPDLTQGGYYPFRAITRRKALPTAALRPRKVGWDIWNPYIDSGLTPWYDVFPLELPSAPIITDVQRIEAEISAGCYYDLYGRNLGTAKPTTPGIYIHRHRTIVVK